MYGPTKLEPDYYFGYRFDTEVIALRELIQARVRQAEVDIDQVVLDRIPPQ